MGARDRRGLGLVGIRGRREGRKVRMGRGLKRK